VNWPLRFTASAIRMPSASPISAPSRLRTRAAINNSGVNLKTEGRARAEASLRLSSAGRR